MFSWFKTAKKSEPESDSGCPVRGETIGAEGRGRTVEVGWLVDTPQATFVYDAPRAVARKVPPPTNAKAVTLCPAMLDHESRLYEVPCPVDLHLRIGKGDKGQPVLVNVPGAMSPVASKKLNAMVHLMSRDRWRDPKRPLVQIAAPWRFIADEPVWMTQMPAFNNYRDPPIPGTLIGGRFPIRLWPRSLMWALDWHDPTKDLILKRGEPWFYVRFETNDPSRPVRLVEAEMTPELREYCQGLDGVTNYVNQSYQLFKTAEDRRPTTLLKKKERS